MKTGIIAFSDRGLARAREIACALEAPEGGTDTHVEVCAGFGPGKVPLAEWTARAFSENDALVFVGACGIAVRAIAPHVAHKTSDPAVVVVDEGARFAISLISGHIGGANRLAERIANAIGAEAVVTTATDGRGLWAVDEWATRRGLFILNPSCIKGVSSRLLAGKEVVVRSDIPLTGDAPTGVALGDEGAHVVISVFTRESPEDAYPPLRLVPPCVSLGVGCRKGTPVEAIERAVDAALSEAGVAREAVCSVSSIDLKRDEVGLRAFAKKRGIPFAAYSADRLAQVEGSVSASAFVEGVTGVDNVCERAALAEGGRLLAPKRAQDGVTVAIAEREYPLEWEDC